MLKWTTKKYKPIKFLNSNFKVLILEIEDNKVNNIIFKVENFA